MHVPADRPDDRFLVIARRATAFTGLLGLVLLAIVGLGIRDGLRPPVHVALPEPDPVGMIEVAPGGVIDPADVPDWMAVLYEGANDHPDPFAAVPCFCGCEAMLGHRHLLDCFARPDGSGWEAHASGCGVCLGEATQVLALLEAGAAVDDIVPAVVERWGDPYLQPEE